MVIHNRVSFAPPIPYPLPMVPAYRSVEIPVESEVLRDNPLGDPWKRVLRVLAPSETGGEPLPVVWILPAYAGTAAALLEEDPWSENLLQQVNRLSREGALGRALFAIPDCFTSLGGSQYLDSPAVGAYQTHLWEELRPLVEERFPCNGRHGVAGRSSGGFGAFLQAVHRPEHVRAIACHAADMAFEYCYLGSFPALARAIRRHGDAPSFLRAFREARKKRSGEWFEAIQALCMAACYSPSPDAPLGIDLPIEPADAAIRAEVWERWLAFDPVRMVDREDVAQTLRSLDLFFLDCGSRDEYHLQWGMRQLVAKLGAAEIPHESEEFDDGHRSTGYRFDVSLPKLVRALGGDVR